MTRGVPMKRIILVLLLVLAFASPATAEMRCDYCKMKIPDGSNYKVALTLKDGGRKVVCSLFCASIENERSGGDITGMTVLDYLTGEEVRAEDAIWVEGGDARAVMSEEPRVAFKDKEKADAFAGVHGGKVVPFGQAYGDSVKEWKGR